MSEFPPATKQRSISGRMKRQSGPSREENYEHVLMCLICRSLFDDYDHQPKFLPCHHTFCKDCLREYVRQMGDEIECPSCRKITNIPAAGVSALQTNFYVKYIQSLVSGASVDDGVDGVEHCSAHNTENLNFYCQDCQRAVCRKCTDDDSRGCMHTSRITLTHATETFHQRLDGSFAAANAAIEKKKITVEAMMRGLAQEKDSALKKIDTSFEQYTHTLHRRATLLKNKVIDIYNEHVGRLESDLEEVSTALTCIVSLKEYHEGKISRFDFKEFDKGVEEMDEVRSNITKRVNPAENHITFEEKHGVDKFKGCTRDLGRVRHQRPPQLPPDPEEVESSIVLDASFGSSGLSGAGASSSTPSTPDDLTLTTAAKPLPDITYSYKHPPETNTITAASHLEPKPRDNFQNAQTCPTPQKNANIETPDSKTDVDLSIAEVPENKPKDPKKKKVPTAALR